MTIAYIISTAKHSQNIIQLAQYCILATTNYYIIYYWWHRLHYYYYVFLVVVYYVCDVIIYYHIIISLFTSYYYYRHFLSLIFRRPLSVNGLSVPAVGQQQNCCFRCKMSNVRRRPSSAACYNGRVAPACCVREHPGDPRVPTLPPGGQRFWCTNKT